MIEIRVSKELLDEIDEICEKFPELGYTRKKFIDSALKQKISNIKFIKGDNVQKEFDEK